MNVRLRANPFTPGKRLTRPELFSGRTDQTESGMRLLLQASQGNVRHGLITGERGIGKSSLSSHIQGLAKGEPNHFERIGMNQDDFDYAFVVAEHIAQGGQTAADVAGGLLRQLEQPGRLRKRLRVENLQFDFKLFRGDLMQAKSADDVVTAFVSGLEAYWEKVQDEVDGVVLVVDEVDRIADEPGVASFFKVATETMTARGLEQIMFLLVGMVGVGELLKADHSSINRVFEVIHVPQLSVEESKEVVNRALLGTGVGIDDESNARVAALAGGFPHPIHLLGFEAFDADRDDLIDKEDLDAAIASVVTEKWKEDFDASYIQAGSGKHRDIIKVMASHDDEDVPSAWICEQLGVKQPEISSNINILMNRDVIVRPDRGVYRFKDPLFRLYVRQLNVLGREPVERRPRRRKA